MLINIQSEGFSFPLACFFFLNLQLRPALGRQLDHTSSRWGMLEVCSPCTEEMLESGTKQEVSSTRICSSNGGPSNRVFRCLDFIRLMWISSKYCSVIMHISVGLLRFVTVIIITDSLSCSKVYNMFEIWNNNVYCVEGTSLAVRG